jgi:rhamnosyltransferase
MISVIIPIQNPPKEIVNLFLSLKEQTVFCEIIVIDSQSGNGLADLARRHKVIFIPIKSDEFDHGGTRTIAARQASRDIIVYMTQDAVLTDRNALERLVEPFNHDPQVGATFGRQLPAVNASVFASHLRSFNYPPESCVRSFADRERLGIKAAFISNGFAAYCKKALQKIGWFKDGLILCEDTYAGMRLLSKGYKIAYVSDATVSHSHNYSVKEEARRYFDIGVFHKQEEGVLKDFGKPEKEGLRYVQSGMSYLMQQHRFRQIPEFIVRGAAKYFSYTMGRNYEKIPKSIIKRMSMHRSWWDKGLRK